MKKDSKKTNTRRHFEGFQEAQKDLADAVNEAREATKDDKFVTQEELAEKSVFESECLKRIENGKGNPQYSTLYPLITNLNVDPYKIFYRKKYDSCPNLMDLIHLLMVNCSDSEAKKMKPFIEDFIKFFRDENTKNIE